jgi:hypothetical protein
MWTSGWFVKDVPSGDTVVVVAAEPQEDGLPSERRISLSSLTAPRMVRSRRRYCACPSGDAVLALFTAAVSAASMWGSGTSPPVSLVCQCSKHGPATASACAAADAHPNNLQPRRDGSTMSEEFAWESREFLRKHSIGRVR